MLRHYLHITYPKMFDKLKRVIILLVWNQGKEFVQKKKGKKTNNWSYLRCYFTYIYNHSFLWLILALASCYSTLYPIWGEYKFQSVSLCVCFQWFLSDNRTCQAQTHCSLSVCGFLWVCQWTKFQPNHFDAVFTL